MNRELCNLIEWFEANLLYLNISKTNYIVFSEKRNITANILIGDTPLVKLEHY